MGFGGVLARSAKKVSHWKEQVKKIVIAMCVGAEPLPREAVQEASAQLKRTEPLDQDGLVQLGARWRALTKDSAAAALSPEAAQLAERQVEIAPRHILHKTFCSCLFYLTTCNTVILPSMQAAIHVLEETRTILETI